MKRVQMTEDRFSGPRLQRLVESITDAEVSHAHLAASGAIFRAHRITTARVQMELSSYELSSLQYEVLALIAAADGGRLSFSDLKRELLQYPSTLTYTVDSLEKRRLLRRVPHPDDRRAIVAQVTPGGAELARRATAALGRVKVGLEELTELEAERVTRILLKLSDVEMTANRERAL